MSWFHQLFSKSHKSIFTYLIYLFIYFYHFLHSFYIIKDQNSKKYKIIHA